MKRRPRLILLIIILLTIFASFINLPKFKNFDQFDQNKIFRKINITHPLEFRQGLDLQGGASITFRADMKEIKDTQEDSALESAKEIIERRVNLFGVSEPVVQTAIVGGDRRIIVEIPGITDINSAINLIGTTAQLTFWEQGASAGGKTNKTDLTGSDISSASVGYDSTTGKPQVQLNFNSQGAKKFADITARNVGKPVAIVLDNQLISNPVVQQSIPNGNAVINGNFTLAEVKQLVTQLNAGALPVPLTVLEQHVVGPSLGAQSLKKSFVAGSFGLITILIFMIALYGKRGIVASIALILYALFTLSIFKISSLTPYGVTLTLAGIAGFILSIGMAVDANILIFERTKEEERGGRSSSLAIELGFQRAWTSIRDSNVSTLITCLILYSFGTGIIKGFAIVLAVGVLISMFTAITVTRTLLRILNRE